MRYGLFSILKAFILITYLLANGKHLILTSNLPPLSICDSSLSESNSDFTGIEIEVFKNATRRMNWTDDDYSFSCLSDSNITNWTSFLPESYLGYIGGLAISYEYQNNGYIFSLPTFESGLSILVLREKDPWSMIKVFTLEIALLIVGSAIVMGLLHFFLEEQRNPLETYIWSAFGNLFFCNQVSLKKFSSKIILCSFWFMVLIVQSTLTANLVNLNSSNNVGINSVTNLYQKKVKALDENSDLLLSYGAKPVPLELGHSNANIRMTEDIILQDLKRDDNDRVDAFCVEDYLAAELTYKYCDIAAVSRTFEPKKYAMLFSKNASKSIKDDINLAIKQQTEEETSFFLLNNYLYKSFSKCIKDPDDDKLDFQDVKGLLFVMIGAAVVGVAIFFFSRIPWLRKVSSWLEVRNILEKAEEDENKLTGDDLIVHNLKQSTKKVLKQFEDQILWRLEDFEGVVDKYVRNGGFIGRTEKIKVESNKLLRGEDNSYDFNLKTREEFSEENEIESKMNKEFTIRKRKF